MNCNKIYERKLSSSEKHQGILRIKSLKTKWAVKPSSEKFNLSNSVSRGCVNVALGVIHKLRNAFFNVFYYPPTYSNALAVILLINSYTKVCASNAFANYPPTPIALRNL